MSFEKNYAVERVDILKCTEINFKEVTDPMVQNPESIFVTENRNEGRKIAEELPTALSGQVIAKAVNKISLFPTKSQFELSSLPESYDIKEEESEDSAIPLSAVKFRRKSLNWSEELVKVSTTPGSSEHQVQEIYATKPDFELILKHLQYGIKESLKKLPKNPERDVLMTDFSMVEEINILNDDPRTTDSKFTLFVYAPVAFRFFRDIFGITTEDFAQSVCEASLYYHNSSSRSGSEFFSTFDDRFVLKTVPKKEAKFLMKLFPGYFLNLTQHCKTLLPKYYGLYVYEKGVKRIRLLIMNNILPRIYKFSETYDLKGSTYSKRRSIQSVENHENELNENITLKDLDLLDRWPEGFYLQQEIHKILLKSIERDCKVLESYDIMDYSLLLGIVLPDSSNSLVEASDLISSNISASLKKNRNLIGPFEARTMKGDTVYLFVGIIDILQSYNWKKKFEYRIKSLFYRSSSISVNRPDFYSQRFRNFLVDHVFKCIPSLVPSSKRGSSPDL